MKMKISLIAALIVRFLFTTAAFARSSEIEIVNKTGSDIRALYISPVASNRWQRYAGSIRKNDDEDIRIDVSSSNDIFDIRCTYRNGDEDVWYGVDLYNCSKVILRSDGQFSTSGRGSHHSNSRYRGHDDDDDDDDDYYARRY